MKNYVSKKVTTSISPARGTGWWLISGCTGVFFLLTTLVGIRGARGQSIVVDSFELTHSVVANGPSSSSGSLSVQDADILGGERDIFVELTSGGVGTTVSSIGAYSGSSVLAHRESASAGGASLISWDGPDNDATVLDPTGLGGVDITVSADGGSAQDSFSIWVTACDQPPVEVLISVYTDAGNWSSYLLSVCDEVQGGDPGFIYVIPYSGFTSQAGSGADFTDVGAVTMEISPLEDGSNFSIRRLRTEASGTGTDPGIFVDKWEAGHLVAVGAGSQIGSSDWAVATGSGILGGERDVYIEATSDLVGSLSSGIDGGNQTCYYDEGTSAEGIDLLSWDGPDGDGGTLDSTGLAGFDLTVPASSAPGCPIQEFFLFNLRSLDHIPVDFTISVYTDASNWSSYTWSRRDAITEPEGIFYHIPYSSFTSQAGTGADFTSVGAVTLLIDPVQPSTDLKIGQFRTRGQLGCLGDQVWLDLDGDGIQDAGEPGISGVTVNLYDPGADGEPGGGDDLLTDTMATDSNGNYGFCSLPPGDYYLEFVLPAGYTFSPRYQGGDGTIDSDADPATGQTVIITMVHGEHDTSWDAGMIPPPPTPTPAPTPSMTATPNATPTATPSVIPTPTPTPSPAPVCRCFVVSQSGFVSEGYNQLTLIDTSDYNPDTNETDIGTTTTTTGIEAIIYDDSTGTLYAVDYDQLGILDQTTGLFTPLPNAVDIRSGKLSGESFKGTKRGGIDIDGLSIHPETGIIYASVRLTGRDLIIQLDKTTGKTIPGVFGGNDYLVVEALLPGIDDIDDLAFDPVDGALYAIENNSGQDDYLIIIDLDSGAVTDQGRLKRGEVNVADMEGLGFGCDGTLWGITGNKTISEHVDRLWEIDKTDGSCWYPRQLSHGTDYEAITCGIFDQTASPTPAQPVIQIDSGDYDGNGTSDIAVFRESSGLWAVRGVTRAYFGDMGDYPVSADYNGDGTTEIAIFRPDYGLWAIQGVSRAYFGSGSDLPQPGDYNGDGTNDIGVFRSSSGLWAIRGVTRVYFGAADDTPVPGDYTGDGSKQVGIFRAGSGLWALRSTSRIYFGGSGDTVVPGDYDGDGSWEAGIFRPSSGLWAIRGTTRTYFGNSSDQVVPADYNGASLDEIGIFRADAGLWAIKGVTRVYFGTAGDLPVTR